jgi:hypothetical protein
MRCVRERDWLAESLFLGMLTASFGRPLCGMRFTIQNVRLMLGLLNPCFWGCVSGSLARR